jgi:hypothetical protein
MTLRLVLAGAVAAGLVAIAVGPASAAPSDEDSDRSDRGEGRRDEWDAWSITLHGGALLPLSAMADTHQTGLVAGARIAWSSRIGLGLEVSGAYSPLPGRPVDEIKTETHYGTLTAGPRFTLGRGLWRATIAAGGGGSFERTRLTQGDTDLTSTRSGAIVEGRAALEMHVVPGGGLVVGGGYTHSFGDDEYRYAAAGAGLMLTF